MKDLGKDSEFQDPVVRCMSCQNIVPMVYIRKHGACPGDGKKGCGGHRVSNIREMTIWELKDLKDREVDNDFLKLFEITCTNSELTEVEAIDPDFSKLFNIVVEDNESE